MKFMVLLTVVACLSGSARGLGQTITLSLDHAPLETVFSEIRRQTGLSFIYTRDQVAQAKPVTIEVKNVGVGEVLEKISKDQEFIFIIQDRYIVVRQRQEKDKPILAIDVQGKVVDEEGNPLEGVTVKVKRSGRIFTTDANGEFRLEGIDPNDVLIISRAEMETIEVSVEGRSHLFLTLKQKIASLDETIVIGYGKTTRRLTTGSVSKVTAAEISRQPVSNPLAALQGRVAGLYLTQSNGLPGSNFNALIRGQNSLKQGSQPLYIVDGVPFMLNSGSLNQITGLDINNPLNSINPLDIESIEVLKDADATSIYGSQAANGVILITTRKGKSGKLRVALNYFTGIGQVAKKVKLLNTSQYLEMRREAMMNDGMIPDPSNAPDLFVWDTARNTDWKEELIGNSSSLSNYQLSLSGGNTSTQFILSANYNRETTVFPFDKASERGTGRIQIDHGSSDNKFKATISSSYSFDLRRLPIYDLTRYTYLPPNTPSVYDSTGKISWEDWVDGIDNPFAGMETDYRSETNNWMANVLMQYRVLPGVFLKLNTGYNYIELEEQSKIPITAQRPSVFTTGASNFGIHRLKSYVAEPQIEFEAKWHQVELKSMAGFSFQQRKQSGIVLNGTGYTSDDLLGSIAGAATINALNSNSQYNYLAGFARVNLILNKRYILNLNGRRDGSSRFGPANRYSSFGSAGLGWIFSEESIVKENVPFLSFGKLRGSFGVSGNDQIGDYQYLDAWSSSSSFNYQQVAGILPSRLFNPYFGWERTRKFEVGLDMGFIKDRIVTTLSYYRNRSDNQLVNYRLPYTTGFTTILKNLDALIQNSGIEVELTSRNIQASKFQWQTKFNLTIPRNKLLAYPGLENSTDRYNYLIGQPLNIIRQFHYVGIDPQTGTYTYEDVDGDGNISGPNDYSVVSFVGARCYGGISNEFTLKNWNFSFFIQFVSQSGRSYQTSMHLMPGAIWNQPLIVLDRWRNPGNVSTIQRFSADGSLSAIAYQNYRNSDASVTNASFTRLKNVSISYSLEDKSLTRLRLTGVRFYLQGQNLITMTRYNGADPETQSLTSLPPLRVLTIGAELIF